MRNFRSIFLSLLLTASIGAGQLADAAEPLPEAQSSVLLTVSGAISVTNADGQAEFDLGLLQSLRQVEYRTTTIWTDGERTFVGVPLSALLDRLGIHDGTLKAQAINDYAVEIPVSSIEADAPMVAFLMDSEPMSRRDKGPLWIVYPYDSDPKYRTEVNFSRSIWQLNRIEAMN